MRFPGSLPTRNFRGNRIGYPPLTKEEGDKGPLGLARHQRVYVSR